MAFAPLHGWWRAATRTLRRAAPFDGICLLLLDPATLLPTGELVEDGLPAALLPRLLEIELAEQDSNSFRALAGGGAPAANLSAATGGRLEESLRQRELRRPSGFEDELRAVLSDADGTWGALTLLRGLGTPHFTSGELGRVARLAPQLADGLRQATLQGALEAGDPAVAETGFLVLDADGQAERTNPAADRWLDELGASDGLPAAVLAATVRARQGQADTIRARTTSGGWAIVRATALSGGAVAVTIEAARGPALAPLIADAYGLTERERTVTQLVAQGLSTNAIGTRLHLSPYTVQDHLKAIFDKTGTGSRGELVARLFFEHYAPRLTA
jgi:DNA-binding CsgD family transcriptional regulator